MKIKNFNSDSNFKLSVSGGDYFVQKNGKDLILTVGEDSVTLKNAASLKGSNIIGTKWDSITDLIEDIAPNNVILVSSKDTGTKDISLTEGDLALVEKTTAKVNISSSNSFDTVISQGENVYLKLNDGATDIYPLDGRITLENYDDKTGSGFHADYANAKFIKGKLSLGSAVMTFDDNADSKFVNFFDTDGDTKKVGFADNSATLNASDRKENLLLFAGHSSTILGGEGDNKIYVDKEAFVDTGAGRNKIYLAKNSESTIQLGDGSKNIIHNFNATFDDGDKILIDALSSDFEFDGKDLMIEGDSTRALLKAVSSSDGYAKLLTASDNKEVKVAIAQEDSVITIDGDKKLADLYIGDESGVDFTGVKSSLVADLRDDSHFRGINELTAGNGRSTLIGLTGKETLKAGTSDNSIWSGSGNDEMFGKGGSPDKKGSTTFFFRSGDEHDTVSDFEFLTQENLYGNTADKISVDSLNDITNVFCANNDVVLKINDATDYLTIKEARGKVFQINDLKAKVDRNISYDGLANCYFSETGSSLTVDSSVGSAEIWLDNSHGTLFLGTPIRTLDASAVEGNTSLVGNAFDNTIMAGYGDSSLWGGYSSSNDLLIGGDSHNTFFYCNGNDTIRGANDGDDVILSDISLDQITEARITSRGVFVSFNNGGSLMIEGRSDVTYQLADGSKYSANHETLKWISK